MMQHNHNLLSFIVMILVAMSLFSESTTSALQQSTTTTTTSNSRLVFGQDDALFGCIEQQQEGRPFGSVLDAGTGLHSLRWIATLPARGMTSFTAVTADSSMQQKVQFEAQALGIHHLGEFVVGNWFSSTTTRRHDNNNNGQEKSLQLHQTYDTILADYLIGAMDGFSPYRQDQMIPKLAQYLNPGGRLYIVGMQPIPNDSPNDANIICKVRQVRDACILLAGHCCYREYPVDWVERQVEAVPHLAHISSRQFPILYRHATICKQIKVGRSKFKRFESPALVNAMKQVLDDLEQASLEATQRAAGGKIPFGFDYIVTAEKKK